MNYKKMHSTEITCTYQVTISEKDVSTMADSVQSKKQLTNFLYTKLSCFANRAIDTIITEEKIIPVCRPKVILEKFLQKSPWKINLQFEILPAIALPEDLTQLQVHVLAPEHAYDEALKLLLRIRRSRAQFTEIHDKHFPCDGDVLTIDVSGTIDGKLLSGMSARNYKIYLSDSLKNDEVLEAALRTMNAGETKTTEMVCPQDYPMVSYRGKMVQLQISLKKICTEQLPELSDSLAQEFGFANANELWKAVFLQATSKYFQKTRAEGQKKLLGTLLEQQDFPVPSSVYDFFWKEYVQEFGCETEQKEKQDALIAEHVLLNARAHCFLLALARREGVVISQESIDEQVHTLAQKNNSTYEKTLDALQASGELEHLHERLEVNKALDMLYDKAQKIVVDAKGNPVPLPDPN